MSEPGTQGSDLTDEEKYVLITRNLQETINGDAIKTVLKSRDLKVYWGTAITGKPHAGYLIPLAKISDFLRAGCEVTVMLGDVHGILDGTSSWDVIANRAKYYESVIRTAIESTGVCLHKLTFVRGSEFQLTKPYMLDLFQLSKNVSVRNVQKAGADVVKQNPNPSLGSVMYPCLQALDESHLEVDAQLGGTDQRSIFGFARRHLSKRVGCVTYLMNPILSSLCGGKMSSSLPNSVIDLCDSWKVVERKISKTFCEPGNIENNWPLDVTKLVIFPIIKDCEFLIPRKEEFGGDVVYHSYEEVERSFRALDLHPADLKQAVAIKLDGLLDPVRKLMESPKGIELLSAAYPTDG